LVVIKRQRKPMRKSRRNISETLDKLGKQGTGQTGGSN
jgi:hypothetical protein